MKAGKGVSAQLVWIPSVGVYGVPMFVERQCGESLFISVAEWVAHKRRMPRSGRGAMVA